MDQRRNYREITNMKIHVNEDTIIISCGIDVAKVVLRGICITGKTLQ